MIDALTLCNSCDAEPADPSSLGGYCKPCLLQVEIDEENEGKD